MTTKLDGVDYVVGGCGCVVALLVVAVLGGFAFILWAVGWRLLNGA